MEIAKTSMVQEQCTDDLLHQITRGLIYTHNRANACNRRGRRQAAKELSMAESVSTTGR